MNAFINRIIRQWHNDSFEEMEDCVAVEKKLRVMINNKEALSLYCTPLMIKELVVGFIMTEGIIKGEFCFDRLSIIPGDEVIAEISTESDVDLSGKTVTSGCIGGVSFEGKKISIVTSSLQLTAKELKELYSKFQSVSSLYKLTGCVHSSALASKDGIEAFAEDVGRHNAVDKVVGYSIIEGIGFDDKILLTSGRISSELASKCARWGIPIIVSRTAPTSLTVEIADKYGVTIVGFMRGGRFNVYTHPERII